MINGCEIIKPITKLQVQYYKELCKKVNFNFKYTNTDTQHTHEKTEPMGLMF